MAAEKRTVIVAIDGSEHADQALDWYFTNIYKKEDEVILVYVPEIRDTLQATGWTATVYQFDKEVMTAMLEEERRRINAELEMFAKKLTDRKVGGRVISTVARRPGEGIVEAAVKEKAHLIVVGSRGLGQLRRTFMGSVSDYVVHHAHIPVLVCKHPKEKPSE